jgi:phenylpropionate dioxygenase-like ring-hydroxylating dioxygenase large terminal subunit/AcrR family transcriptional regulator
MSAASPAAPEGAKEPIDARRRRQLIEAAITSIADHGLSGTTVAKVAEIAGLSPGIVSFYFRSKDGLLLATLEHVDGEFAARQREAELAAGDDPVRQLEAMIEVGFDPAVCDPRRVAVWTAFWGEVRAREDYRRVCGSREAEEERRVVALFERIARDGEHHRIDATALGQAFHHLLSSLPEEMLDDARSFDPESAKAVCRSFLMSVFPSEFSGREPLRDATPDLEVATVEPQPTLETLPTWVYHDPEFHALEMESVFRRHWLLLGHASEAPRPGDYLTLDLGDERVFAIRGRDGLLRAFHNVCRHRAARVVRGESGSCRGAIVCPYHGWSYGFDGTLRGVPAEESFHALDKERLGLPSVELEEWQGFVFVRLGGEGPDVRAVLGPFETESGLYRFPEMKPWGRRWSRVCDFNWKVFAENDAEGYHMPSGHPGLRRLLGDSHGDGAEPGEGSRSFAVVQEAESSGWSERMYQRLLPRVEHLPEDRRRAWIYYGIFPTAVLAITPALVDCTQVLPLGPDRCRIHGFRVALEDPRREMRAARYLNSRIVRSVVKEDLELCANAHGGVRSSGYCGGPLSDLESGVRRFQDRIRDLVPAARSAARPAPGHVAELNERMRIQGSVSAPAVQARGEAGSLRDGAPVRSPSRKHYAEQSPRTAPESAARREADTTAADRGGISR